jgi:putative DNA primase/helicase
MKKRREEMAESREFEILDAENKIIKVLAKRIGREWRANCPFHIDIKHPNLDINEEKGVYLCRACGASGCLNGAKFVGKKVIEKVYDYKNEKGQLVFQVVKYAGKDFKQRRPDGKDGWIWNLKGVKRVIYNLPEILKKLGKMLFIPEGEKDCDNLAKIGILATTNSGGAGKWRPEYNQYLKGREAPVILLPDNDEIGFKHAQDIGRSLKGIAKSIKWLILPGLKKGEDVSNWLERGGDLKKLFELVKTCPEFISPPEEEKKDLKIITGEDFRPTDLWNSENFYKKYEGQLLFCKRWNSWLVYREGKWQEDDKNETQELAKKVILDYYREASGIIDDQTRKRLVDQARKSESQRAIRAMTELATSNKLMAVVPDDFDRDHYILNLKDGTLDLKTMKFRGHKPEDFLTKRANINYDPEAICPKWLAFLDKIFQDNKNLIDFLQTSLGYSLTGDTGEQCLFILYGIGFNGKSTFINTSQEILGDYAINTPFDTFLSKIGGHIPNDLARMKSARFVTAEEAGEGRKFNEALLKALTGRDKITARFLRQEYFDFYPNFKLWLATNHKPVVREFSPAFWGRIRLIPFKLIIPEEERIPHYENILLEEKEGIFNWILEGYKKWKEEGLKVPEEIKEATAQYKDQMDIIAEFIEECCIESHLAQATSKKLYSAYNDWCEENKEKPMNSRAFGRRLEERGYESLRIGQKRDRGWGGIDLVNEEEKLTFGED